MSKAFGDFTAEAYDALKAAYADQMKAPLAEEENGYDLQGQNYPLETSDARGDYLEKTKLWKYPDGHSPYEKPDPESLVTALQPEEGDEGIDSLIDEILGEDNDDEPERLVSESAPVESEENEEAS